MTTSNTVVSGRLIQGVVIGSFTVVSPLFISEISPKSVSGSLGMSNQGMVVFGGILAKLFGLIVPLKGDDDILTSDNWKLIFAFPGIISFIQLLLILFIFRFDSPTYYLMHHDLQKYSLINSKIYNKSEGDFSVVCVQDGWGQSNSDKNSWLNQFSISNRKTLIIGWVLSLFQQATGVNCVSFYSNEMFMQGLAGDDAEISARVGTLIVDI